MKFQRLFVTAVICAGILLSCNESRQAQGHYLQNKSFSISIPLNQSPTEKSFGYEFIDDTAVIQPRAIALADKWAFISDPKNHTIKKIDLSTNSIVASAEASDRLVGTYDMIVSDNRIVCSTTNGRLITYDFDLHYIKEISLSSGWGKFYRIDKNQFEVYFPSESLRLYRMNTDLGTISSENGAKSFANAVHGKKLIIKENGREVETSYGVVRLEIPYRDLQYGGNNIEYNDKKLVYFSIDTTRNKLVLTTCIFSGISQDSK